MKLLLAALPLFISTISINLGSTFKYENNGEAEASIKNDCDITKWNALHDEVPYIIKNGEDTLGVELKSSTEYSSFEYRYLETFVFDDINFDFTFLDSEFDYTKNHALSFLVSSDEQLLCKFDFVFKTNNDVKTYDCTFSSGSFSKKYSGMKYTEDGHIQFKIAYESIMDRETGESINVWNFVLGIPKNQYSTSNDKYSVVANKTNDGSFNSLDSIFEKFKGKECSLKVTGSKEIGQSIDLLFTQICDYRFYNTLVLPVSYITVNKVTYTDISFSYYVPELDIDYKGFYIKRYLNGKLDDKILYTTKTAVSKNDSYLKQNSVYEYKIEAISNVSSTGRVACRRVPIEFETLVVTTEKGNVKYLIYGIVGFVVAATSFVLIYIYWYDIKKVFKRHEK